MWLRLKIQLYRERQEDWNSDNIYFGQRISNFTEKDKMIGTLTTIYYGRQDPNKWTKLIDFKGHVEF